ncbi:hypothetical protein GJ496_001779 [Pomphorhynchus laevis]|nr:hypothetical protein GJ496_001779 [Pomphorhynchus laevis]
MGLRRSTPQQPQSGFAPGKYPFPSPGGIPFPPGAYPPGAYPPGAFPPGAFPPGAFPPGAFPPGAFPPGAFPPGAFPPGAFPPGAFPPGAFPPGAFPPGAFPPGAFPPGAFPPGAFPPPFAGALPPTMGTLPGGQISPYAVASTYPRIIELPPVQLPAGVSLNSMIPGLGGALSQASCGGTTPFVCYPLR